MRAGRWVRGLLPLLVLAGLTGASPVYAQSQGAGSAELDEEARTLFVAGRQAFDRGAFEQALERFRAAYELSGRPLLLFNIGTVLDRMRRDDEAIATFRQFVEQAPNSSNVRFAQARIEALAAAGAGESGPSEPGPSEPGPSEPGPSEPGPPSSSGSVTGAPSSSTGSTSSGGGDPLPGIVLMAAGGALVLGTAGTIPWWLDRDSAVSECQQLGCSNGAALAGERDAALVTTLVVGIAGLATIGVGLTLFLMSGSDDAESARVTCAPGVGGMACAGQF